MAAIWASKSKKDWGWGQDVGLQWVPEGTGVRYLGIQVGMVTAFKGKLINWSTCCLSLVGRILVANQVLLASMWYLAVAWNLSPAMCNQIRGIVRNFIWSEKASNARAKVKWETLVLPTAHGGLGIIDPKAQSEALLTKLFVRGLEPGGEPWKELLRHMADQVKLPVHDLGPSTHDINWMFAATKLKMPPTSLWKSILHAWMNVRPGLCKSEPINSTEILRQPVFGNPLIVNQEGKPLGLSDRNEGNSLANAGCSRVRDFWDSEEKDWKGLSALGVSSHPANKRNMDLIISSIPWDPATSNNTPSACEWISKKEARQTGPPQWIYQVVETAQSTANVLEFRKISRTGRIQTTGTRPSTIPLEGYEPVRILAQEKYGATFRLAKDLPILGKKPLLYWILGLRFISDLQWDLGDWHWQQTHKLGDAPFFEYSSKRGYQNARKPHHPPRIIDFIQSLNLRNSTTAQVVARMWHNACPRKVGALIWLTLNKGLPVGTWFETMGLPATCKGYDQDLPESAQHCLWNAPPPAKLGTLSVVSGPNGRRPTASPSLGPSSFWGKRSSKRRTTPRTSKATTLAASLTDVNRSTYSEAFFSTTSGPKDAAGTSTDNTPSTPSRKSYSNPGRPRPRWAWPPGTPSSLLARIGVRISN
jgi:hypothetical protein